MAKDDGGSAFPNTHQELDAQGNPRTEMFHESGMTLRDWFAGMAMQGDLSNGNGINTSQPKKHDALLLYSASEYYRIADAMIAQRNKE